MQAQFQADETRANARKESELILRDAELKARGIVGDSYTEIQRVQQALIQLKHLEEDFRFKFRSLLEGHLKLLDEAPINMAASRPLVVEPAPDAAEETPFVVPAAVDEVPEYPPAAQAAIQPESASAPESATGILAAAAAGLVSPLAPEAPAFAEPAIAAEETVATDPPVPAYEPMPAPAGSGDTETVEQASIFAEFDKAEAERLDGAGHPIAPTAEDPLSGFFFSGKQEGTDEAFPDSDAGGKSKAREFEW